MNSPDVRSALHADGHDNIFVECNDKVRNALTNDTYVSQMQTVSNLLSTAQLRILFYSGQFDMQVSTLSTTRVSFIDIENDKYIPIVFTLKI